MSYSIKVHVEAGVPSVTTSGTPHDGTYEIAGHETGDARSISVMRHLPDGRFAESASHQHSKAV